MVKNDFLDALKVFTEDAVKDLKLPVSVQRRDEEETYRSPEVFKMRMPDMNAAAKKVPYIIHQLTESSDTQPAGNRTSSTVQVRSIFAVYHRDEQEGAMLLLEVMERVRIALLRKHVIADRYKLDMGAGLDCAYYTDNTAPYYAGEMITVWNVPSVEREVAEWLQ